MTTLARENGWRGFDSLGDRVPGGWEYLCDGMPRAMGCGAAVTVPRSWSKIGAKSSGWLVAYGRDDEGGDDLDVVLKFCPSCALVVLQQDEERRRYEDESEQRYDAALY